MDSKIQNAMDEALESIAKSEDSEKIEVQEIINESELSSEDTTEHENNEQQTKDDASDQSNDDRDEQINKLKEQLLRTAADFENFRKRSAREQEETLKFGSRNIIKDFLPVIDNLERALSHAPENSPENYDSLRTGIQMVYQQFLETLKQNSVTPIESVGKPFDPNIHEAMSQIPSDAVPVGHIVEEMQRGYLLQERLLRPAMVVVASSPVVQKDQDQDREQQESINSEDS